MSDDDIRLAERIERAAWIAQIAAAPRATERALVLRSEARGGATLVMASRLPLTLFNRVMGLGIDEPATSAHWTRSIARTRRTTWAATGCTRRR